jgi:thiamine biosynthesis lipoprotein ApbE
MSNCTTRARWRALGTSAELLVTDASALGEARAIVERELDAIDRACSRFRADSELTRVNSARGRAVAAGPLLLEAVQLAVRAAALTDGRVDPTLGVALELAGYDRDWDLLEQVADEQSENPRPMPRVVARWRGNWRAIRIDRAGGTIRIPAGMKLDLGATAKAWAADRAASVVHATTGCGVLLSLGGDIATAGAGPANGWRIHVTDDHRGGPHAPGQTIAISGGGLATSSTTVRRWSHRGQTMHHIIDPRTGACVEEIWRTVSVAASDCADANIAATTAIVHGERAPQWLAEADLPARLVARDGDVLTLGRWPQEEEQTWI